MSIDISNFEFFSIAPRDEESAGVTTARLTQRAGGKLELLSSLATQLSFPDYFGANWDALEESLQDLLPNQGRALMLIHDALPAGLTDPEFRSYLELLDRVIKHRREVGEPKLRALFANSIRQRVVRLVDR